MSSAIVHFLRNQSIEIYHFYNTVRPRYIEFNGDTKTKSQIQATNSDYFIVSIFRTL